MNLDEKKEIIVGSYSQTFDREMAYSKVGLTDEEKLELNLDLMFQRRLELFLIEERELIIRTLRNHMLSGNEKISFQATMEMGKILYPEFFNNSKPADDSNSGFEGKN